MYNINKLKNAIAGAIMAPQYFRNALFSKDYPAGKAAKEERVTASEEERGGQGVKCFKIELKNKVG